jgi:hypothetical protein
METPQLFMGSNSGERRCRFSEKVATMPQYQYDGEKNGAQWRLILKPYFISKAPEIAGILKSIEDHEDQSATVSNLATPGLGVHPETIRIGSLGLPDTQPPRQCAPMGEQFRTDGGL